MVVQRPARPGAGRAALRRGERTHRPLRQRPRPLSPTTTDRSTTALPRRRRRRTKHTHANLTGAGWSLSSVSPHLTDAGAPSSAGHSRWPLTADPTFVFAPACSLPRPGLGGRDRAGRSPRSPGRPARSGTGTRCGRGSAALTLCDIRRGTPASSRASVRSWSECGIGETLQESPTELVDVIRDDSPPLAS